MGELIYLYIDNIGRNIRECGIEFSNRYKVAYNKEKKTINIEKKLINTSVDYGKNIDNLKLLVGKNGCGKSTILDLLGTTRGDRTDEFPVFWKGEFSESIQENEYSWFSLYHLYGNMFAIEGYNSDIIKGLEKGMYLQPVYSVVIEYNFQKNFISEFYPLQEYEYKGRKANKQLGYLFYQIEPNISWITYPQRRFVDDGSEFLFKRQYIEMAGFEAVSHYLYKFTRNKKFIDDFQNNIGACVDIELKMVANSFSSKNIKELEEYKKLLSKAIYGDKEKILDINGLNIQKIFKISLEYSNKECWIIQYLESVLWYVLNKKITQCREIYNPVKEEKNDYKYRKKFLLNFLKQILEQDMKEDIFNIRISNIDYKIIKGVCNGVEKFPDNYFVSDNKIFIEIKDMDSYFVETFMKAMDLNNIRPLNLIDKNDRIILQESLIKINFRSLSSGEAFYLAFYASLYWGINQMKNHSPGDTCILLLDEPDRCFHPEWSRRFIRNLTETLGSKPFNKFNYQIIIATHSPLLLSDVLKEDIICLNTTEDGNIRVEKAPYGFMSNINDILLDSFFIEAPFGAWAKEYVDKLIKRINEISLDIKNEQDIENARIEIEQLEKEVEIIGEELIKDSLLKKINQLKYKIIAKDTLKKNREEEIKYLEERLRKLREND